MKNRRLWISIIAAVLAVAMVLSLIVAILPHSAGAASSSELKNQLDELQAQKDAISQQIADLESQQSENRDELEGIISQKTVIDQQVALLYQQVSNVNTQIAAYNLLISDKQEELEQAQSRLDKLNRQNKERIRAMEEDGTLSYWSVLFMANDFSDLLDRVNMIQEIASADRKRLTEMSEVAQEIQETQAVLAQEKAELETVKEDLEASQKELDEKNAEAEKLLAELSAACEELTGLYDQFEREEEEFLNQLIQKEQEYNDKLAEEESSRLASIQVSIAASVQESIRESSIQASIDASIQESIRQESIQESIRQESVQGSGNQVTTTTPSTGGSESNVDPDGIRWVVPVAYTYVSSPFGYRWHPVTGQWSMHNGVDLPAPMGTPIYATRSGYVTIADYHYTAGNYVTVNHQDGFTSVYMHMTHFVVSAGEYVNAGQLIGYVGSTGRSTGPHLHFGIAYNGEYVNPMNYIG